MIRKLLSSSLVFVVAFAVTGSTYAKGSPGFWLGAGGGYSNGLGGGLELSLLDAIPEIPIGFHFSVGYYHLNEPGVAVDARKIFINNATAGNNNILEYGYNIFFRLDFSYRVLQAKGLNIDAYAGVAHARYLAHFDYQGGNEAFDVVTNPWGATLGARVYFFLSRQLMLTLNGGVEYYFPDKISAHGNFYNPNGQDDNPRAPYTYADADAAIEQPTFSPRVSLTLSFRL